MKFKGLALALVLGCISSVGLAFSDAQEIAYRQSAGGAWPECRTVEEICEASHHRRQCVIPTWIFADALDQVQQVPVWTSPNSCVIDHWETRSR